jgi:threonine synthase
MWRYADALPLQAGEQPVSLGEGFTPLIELPQLAKDVGVRRLWVKDEAVNPTASFKARGLSAAVTRARGHGVPGPRGSNGRQRGCRTRGVRCCGGRAGAGIRTRDDAQPILDTIRAVGADLQLVDGHIGDAGKAATAFAASDGFFNVATLREPYRAEGNKTLGYELAEQLEWRLPDVVVYPTGGGEGVIGMWKAFAEMVRWGWLPKETALPARHRRTGGWLRAAGACVPCGRGVGHPMGEPVDTCGWPASAWPLGDRLVLRALRESRGEADSVGEETIRKATYHLASCQRDRRCPEGGCALAVTQKLVESGRLDPNAEVVVYNTGSGASYR